MNLKALMSCPVASSARAQCSRSCHSIKRPSAQDSTAVALLLLALLTNSYGQNATLSFHLKKGSFAPLPKQQHKACFLTKPVLPRRAMKANYCSDQIRASSREAFIGLAASWNRSRRKLAKSTYWSKEGSHRRGSCQLNWLLFRPPATEKLCQDWCGS